MLRTLRSLLLVSSMTLVGLPAIAETDDGVADLAQMAVTGTETTYSWDKGAKVQPVTVRLPGERTGRLTTVKQLAPAILMMVATVLGLTITFISLRNDMRQRRRVIYRPRGPGSTDGGR
jgi:hypothetical protein